MAVDNQIYDWSEIKSSFADTLVLGNGASRAVAETFDYNSLLEEADLASESRRVFAALNTEDFEEVLHGLETAHRVAAAMHCKEDYLDRLRTTRDDIRKGLIGVVHDMHPTPSTVRRFLELMWQHMQTFRTVLSLNYDLLVYWSILLGNDELGDWFKDGWKTDPYVPNHLEFAMDRTEFEKRWGKCASYTMVYYPHGNMALATDAAGNETKLSKSAGEGLLETLIDAWRTGEWLPLYVAEGSWRSKLNAIRQSPYLDAVFKTEVSRKRHSVALYGWSANEQHDDHIVKALVRAKPEHLALSIHNPERRESVRRVKHVADRFDALFADEKHECEIVMYKAQSAGCWVY